MRIRLLENILYIALRAIKTFDRRQTDLKHLDHMRIRKILVVSNTAIGDTLLATPAIRAIRRRYPDAHICAFFNNKTMELFENNAHVDSVVPYYGGYRRFFSTILDFRKRQFDIAVILHGNEPQATATCYLSGISFIIKLPNLSRFNFLLSNRTPVLTWKDFRHCIEQGIAVARLVGAETEDRRMEVFVDPGAEEKIEGFLGKKGWVGKGHLVGFQVAASHLNTMWFADRFVELGRRILNLHPDAKIVITGSPVEKEYCKRIAADIGEGVIVTAGCLRLREMPELIRMLDLLVSGDTGIMHMAIALGIPVVALFAAADSRSTGPSYDLDKHRVIQKWKTCDPCIGKRCRYQKCMENITVDEVLGQVESVLCAGFARERRKSNE